MNIKKLKEKTKKVDGLKQNSSAKAIIYILVLVLLFFIIVKQSLTVIRLKYDIADLNELANDYKNNNKVLEERIEQMTTDKYIEQEARQRLGMVKTDETPIIVTKKESKKTEIKTIGSKEKVEIYMKDWYVELEDWIEELKRGKKNE